MIHTCTCLEPEEEELLHGASIRTVLEKNPETALFFDIETTGLSSDTSFVFLIGCISFADGHWNLHQYMIRFVQEERELLLAFFEQVRKAQILVHFNGNHFDIPFINKRAASYGLDSPLSALASVDLYQRYRPLKNFLGLKHMNQSTLETWAGWGRTDELSGKEMIGKYWSYSVNGDQETEEKLLGHNRDDLRGMLRVFSLEGYHSLARGEIQPEVRAEEIFGRASLSLSFTSTLPLPRTLKMKREIFPENERPAEPPGAPAEYSLTVNGSNGMLCIPIFKGRLRCYLPDYKNYYYLPLEHQVIHKSVASFVEKEFREPAKPQNCFVEQSGRFLPQPVELFTPALRVSYGSKAIFFSYENKFSENNEGLYIYAQALLNDIFQK